jgi:hypothetical protein
MNPTRKDESSSFSDFFWCQGHAWPCSLSTLSSFLFCLLCLCIQCMAIVQAVHPDAWLCFWRFFSGARADVWLYIRLCFWQFFLIFCCFLDLFCFFSFGRQNNLLYSQRNDLGRILMTKPYK